jgi:hypothetical protein
MRPSIFVVLSVVLVAAPSPLRAQQIGPVSLPLGWERQVVLKRLAKYYDVDASGVVRSKDDPSREIVGSVGFEDGRLTSVSRDWNPSRRGGDANVGAIVSALSQLKGDLACRVQTPAASGPAEEVKAVDVVCGAHSVSIVTGTRTQKGGPAGAAVREVWRVRAFSESPRRPPAAAGRALPPGQADAGGGNSTRPPERL